MNTEIAKIAYELYLKRGGVAGDPVTDWMMAERIYAERRGSIPSIIAETKNVSKSTRAAETRKQSVVAKPVPPKVAALKPAAVKPAVAAKPVAAKAAVVKPAAVKYAADAPATKAKKKS